MIHSNQKPHYWDFPGGPGVKSPDCHAGDAGSIPGQGTKIPHAKEQLPSNLESSLCFIQVSILHNIYAYKLSKQGDNIQP